MSALNTFGTTTPSTYTPINISTTIPRPPPVDSFRRDCYKTLSGISIQFSVNGKMAICFKGRYSNQNYSCTTVVSILQLNHLHTIWNTYDMASMKISVLYLTELIVMLMLTCVVDKAN